MAPDAENTQPVPPKSSAATNRATNRVLADSIERQGALHQTALQFVFLYFALYLLLCRFIEDLADAADFGFFPGAQFLSHLYAVVCAPPIIWIGKHVLHVARPVTYFSGGNSDGIFGFIRIFSIAVLAVLGTVAWRIAGPNRADCARLHAYLRIVIRYSLGFTLLSYGIIKLIPAQFFGLPRLSDLTTEFGDFSPFSLLWNFMGYSKLYSAFAGGVEVLAGSLLLFRRTTTLGALIATAALVNVGFLDFCYQVPEKLDVIFLFLMAGYLLAPELRRIVDFLILNRPTAPATVASPVSGNWRTARLVAKFAVVAYIAVTVALLPFKIRHFYDPDSPLRGVYDVQEFLRNGQPSPPLTTDASRWKRIVFESTSDTYVQTMDDSWHHRHTEFDPAGKSGFSLSGKNKIKDEFTFSRPDSVRLILQGTLSGGPVAVTLKKFDESKFPLASEKFSWVNGAP